MFLVPHFFYPLFFTLYFFYCILPSFFICFSPLHIWLQPRFFSWVCLSSSQRCVRSNHCPSDLTTSSLTRALPSLLPKKKDDKQNQTDVQESVSTSAPGVAKAVSVIPAGTEEDPEPKHRATGLLPFQQGCSVALLSPAMFYRSLSLLLSR